MQTASCRITHLQAYRMTQGNSGAVSPKPTMLNIMSTLQPASCVWLMPHLLSVPARQVCPQNDDGSYEQHCSVHFKLHFVVICIHQMLRVQLSWHILFFLVPFVHFFLLQKPSNGFGDLAFSVYPVFKNKCSCSVSVMQLFRLIHSGVKHWWNWNPIELPRASVFAFFNCVAADLEESTNIEGYHDRAIVYSVLEELCKLHKFD